MFGFLKQKNKKFLESQKLLIKGVKESKEGKDYTINQNKLIEGILAFSDLFDMNDDTTGLPVTKEMLQDKTNSELLELYEELIKRTEKLI